MTIYFGMYGATMTTNCPFFWGPDSIMMLPYMSAPMCATGNFFARMVGINFAIMTLGYAKLGVSKDAWIKQTMLFHVGTIPVFYMMCVNSDGTEFTPWVWYRAFCGVVGGCLHFPRHRRDVSPRFPSQSKSPSTLRSRDGASRRCRRARRSRCEHRPPRDSLEFNPAAPPPLRLVIYTRPVLRPRPRPGPSPKRHRPPRGASAPWRGTGAGGAGCRARVRCRSSAPPRSSGRRAS